MAAVRVRQKLSYVNISITAILSLKYVCYAQELVVNQAGQLTAVLQHDYLWNYSWEHKM